AGEAGQGAADLALDDLGGAAGLALLQDLADADDRLHAGPEHGPGLAVDQLVVLARVLAALGVADGHVLAAQLGQHRGRDLTGVGALGLGVAVLGAEGDRQLVPVDQGADAAQGGERRADRDLDGGGVLAPERPGQLLGELDPLQVVLVHLPVAGDQRAARHGGPSFRRVGWRRRREASCPRAARGRPPPPGDRWAPWSARPNSARAAAESPPPTTV